MNQITISLVNNVGFPITFNTTLVSQAASGDCKNPVVHSINDLTSAQEIQNGEQFMVVINCSNIVDGSFRTDLAFQYLHSQKNIWYPMIGEIRGKAS